jgi:hypothetical protein
LEAVLKAATSTMAERFEVDRTTACRALYDEGVLIADESELSQGKTRFTVKSTVHCEGGRSQRLVALRLERVLGDEPDGADGGPPQPSPPAGGQDGADRGPGGHGAAADGEFGTLFDTGPHTVDDSQQPCVASSAEPSDGPTEGPSEAEETMQPPAYVSRPVTDRDGVVGWTEMAGTDPAPCVVCGMRCGMRVDGVRIHPPCWERTTAGERGTGPTQPAPAEADVPVSTPASTPLPAALASPRPARSGPSGQREQARFRAAAAVVDVDGIWCSSGERIDLPGPLRHVGDLARLAQWLNLGTQVTKWHDASAQIWVGRRLLTELGVDVQAIAGAPVGERDKVARDVTRGSAAVTAALRDGYRVGGREGDALGRWTRVWRGTEKSVWVVLLPALNPDGDEIPLLRGDPDHATLARRIGLLADALGHPYQLSGSTTGLDLMIALRWRERETLFAARTPVPPAAMNVEPDISWCRTPTGEEKSHRFVHAYDRSGSYLAGVAGLELGVGDPTHHPDGCVFQAKTPGYWRVEIPAAGDWRMPNPIDPRGAWAGKIRWITTPGLEFAVEQGYDPAILEAYTWPERARILDPWYERIRDARTRLDVDDPQAQAARNQLKAVYAPTIGMLGSQIHMEGRDGYAPDRRHQIIAKARTNILRRVAQIGRDSNRWPVAIIADTVIYTSDEQDPVAAWPGTPDQLGRALGRYKAEGSGPLEDQLPYLTGGPYRGKPSLVDGAPGSE